MLLATAVPWDDSTAILCPLQCTCQYSTLVNLPIARWIDVVQVTSDQQQHPFAEPETNIKFVMCILQNELGFTETLSALPEDIQALTFLYTGSSANITGAFVDVFHCPNTVRINLNSIS